MSNLLYKTINYFYFKIYSFFMELGFSVAVLSGEVRDRLPMTIKCIDSINKQTFKNLQKILVNGGSPPHQTQEILNQGVDLSDWIIIDFPIDTMVSDGNWNMHKWTGQAALHAATMEFFFALNDDDFLDIEFFEKIDSLLKEYPYADSAMGLRVTYNHDEGIYGSVSHPVSLQGILRPRIESGIDLVRELFFKGNLAYGPSIGFQPVCRTKRVREVSSSFFSKGFYPDVSPYFQIVPKSKTIFDVRAHMYWGVHKKQDQWKWMQNNYWLCSHDKVYREFSKTNIDIFKKILPYNAHDLNEIKKYFKRRIVSESLFSLTNHYSIMKIFKKHHTRIVVENPYNVVFPIYKHLFIILKHPKTFFTVVWKNLK